MKKTYWGGIEGGGTKFNCIVGSEPGDIYADTRIPTTTPKETLGKAVKFFKQAAEEIDLVGIGVGSFGPLDPDPRSPNFGCITDTPKPGWTNTNIVGFFKKELNLPINFDTDVNVAALGEWRWGAAQGLDTFIYLTIGTGIGGGGLVNGKLMHGLLHPEMGHIRIPHDIELDPFPGSCPFHGDCFEGLANGPAMQARWGQPAETLPNDHPAWQLEAKYIALGVANFILTLSPQRVVIGGGVMKHAGIIDLVRGEVLEILGGYVKSPAILENMEEFIVLPKLGDSAGRWGAVALASSTMVD